MIRVRMHKWNRAVTVVAVVLESTTYPRYTRVHPARCSQTHRICLANSRRAVSNARNTSEVAS